MTENNAAQPGLTDAIAVLKGLRSSLATQRANGPSRLCTDSKALSDADDELLRALKILVPLSKLRAEGVQAGDERAAFEAAEREINSRVDLSFEWRTEEYANPWVMDRWRTWRRAWKSRAALASAPVAGEAAPFSPDWANYRQGLQDGKAEASEAVRQQLADSYREELDKLSKRNYELRMENAAFKTQADKDGGDCAKGGAETGATTPESRASAFGIVVLPPLPTPPEHKGHAMYAGSQMMVYARDAVLADRQQCAALSPTPSVVKQSLTATQTGEKGESDA